MDVDEVLTPDEVAEFLKLPKMAIMNGFRSGEIKGFKIRGRVRFLKSELMKDIRELQENYLE